MRKHILPIAFFLILAFGFVGTLFCLGTTFSSAERRVLSAFPKADAVSLNDWTWDDDFENYFSDHLILRNVLTGVSAYMRLGTGTVGLDEIYRTRSGQLVESPVRDGEANRTVLTENLKRLDRLSEEEGLPLYMVVPPSAGYAARDSLPAYLRGGYRDDQLLGEMDSYPNLTVVNLWDALCEGGGDRFYRTDNHWNVDGAYAAYAKLLAACGKEAIPNDAIAYESDPDFHGSTLSRSALWLTSHEAIRFPLPDCAYTVQIDEEPLRTDLYFREALDSYDPYNVFLNGNHGTVRIQNLSDGAEGVVLIVKDSFANALVPLLLPHYRTVIMIDPRFYRGTVRELIAAEHVDTLVCVCSLKTLATDPALRRLR